MEKSVAVVTITNEVKVSNQLHIPDDLAFSILSKLSLKSLKRFGCVHRSWSLLFENPHFMKIYRNNFLSNDHSYYDGTSLLLHQRIDAAFDSFYYEDTFALHSLSGERFENKVKLNWPNPFPEADNGFDILGSGCINGIFCLSCILKKNIVLWNPVTTEFKVIPPSPLDYVPYWEVWADQRGFSYDPVTDDYKVIRHVHLSRRTNHDLDGLSWGEVPYGDISDKYLWDIYSLRSNSWKKLDVDVNMPRSCDRREVYMYGMNHWWGKNETHNEACLVSFNSGKEVFFTTPIPSDMDDNFDDRLVWRDLMVLNGSISFILTYTETSTFHISILGELGVKESWTKLFIVGPLPCLEYPIGAGRKGDIFFRKKDGELAWIDLSTQMIEELGIDLQRFCCRIVIYKESLLPIGGINN